MPAQLSSRSVRSSSWKSASRPMSPDFTSGMYVARKSAVVIAGAHSVQVLTRTPFDARYDERRMENTARAVRGEVDLHFRIRERERGELVGDEARPAVRPARRLHRLALHLGPDVAAAQRARQWLQHVVQPVEHEILGRT